VTVLTTTSTSTGTSTTVLRTAELALGTRVGRLGSRQSGQWALGTASTTGSTSDSDSDDEYDAATVCAVQVLGH
jgi:hypothetical protein